MRSDPYDPKTLPECDGVSVFVLSGGERDERAQFGWFDPLRDLEPTDAEAREIATLWRSLPPAGQKRCHFPVFGVRFSAAGDPLVEARICFRCNNVSLVTGAGKGWFEFDAEAPPSRRLLELFRQCAARAGIVDLGKEP